METNPTKNNKRKKGFIDFIILFVMSIAIMATILFIFIGIEKLKDNNDNTTMKNSPAVTIEETFSGLLINIQAKDDYEYVIVKVDLYNNNQENIKSFTVREDNIKKGSTKQIKYELSPTIHFEARYTQCYVLEYK